MSMTRTWSALPRLAGFILNVDDWKEEGGGKGKYRSGWARLGRPGQVGSRSWDVTDGVNKVRATSVFRIGYLKRSRIIVAAGGLTPAHLTVITHRGDGGVYRRLDSTGGWGSVYEMAALTCSARGGPAVTQRRSAGCCFYAQSWNTGKQQSTERDQISVEFHYESPNRNIRMTAGRRAAVGREAFRTGVRGFQLKSWSKILHRLFCC